MSKKVLPGSGRLPRTYIRAWRERKGYTLNQIAERIDATTPTLSRVETGIGMLTWGVVNAISEALGVPAYDLLFRDPENDGIEDVVAAIRAADPVKQALIADLVRSVLAWNVVASGKNTLQLTHQVNRKEEV